jgi:hypothetical protein
LVDRTKQITAIRGKINKKIRKDAYTLSEHEQKLKNDDTANKRGIVEINRWQQNIVEHILQHGAGLHFHHQLYRR